MVAGVGLEPTTFGSWDLCPLLVFIAYLSILIQSFPFILFRASMLNITIVAIKAILKPNSNHFATLALGNIEKSKGNKLNSVAVEATPKRLRNIKMLFLNTYLSKAREMEYLISNRTSIGLCIHSHLPNSAVISGSRMPS